MKSKIFLFGWLLAIGSLASAQTNSTLKVSVSSAQNASKIAFASVYLKIKNTIIDSAKTDVSGVCTFKNVAPKNYLLDVKAKNFQAVINKVVTITAGKTNSIAVQMQAIKTPVAAVQNISDLNTTGSKRILLSQDAKGEATKSKKYAEYDKADMYMAAPVIHREEKIMYEQKDNFVEGQNTESYNAITENDFLRANENPFSTFSIDVDNASLTNSRRYIDNGSLPPADAVRIEEFINYFNYDYKKPTNKNPFSINTEVSVCPWNTKHKLVHVGLQGKRFPFETMAPTNLVFLIDVSGSMNSENRLPLVKKSLTLLVNKMREQDKIALVVYAGAAGLVLPSTSGADKKTIIDALNNLQSGGSTAGGAGINLAYKIAKENAMLNGNNRVMIATDGDFNVGSSSDGEMKKLIESKREEGIFLTVLGFGMGNYKDSKMETIADNGNGNYFYIDNINEAKKVLVDEVDGTLYTIAKDVKIQIEFNPAKVQAYRLIGYENRMLKKEDFNNDKKDAGELGAGHTVTALYEVVPVGVEFTEFNKTDELRYQKNTASTVTTQHNDELMLVKLRYKEPNENTSKLITQELMDKSTSLENASDDFRFSAAVAEFCMVLRGSEHKAKSSIEHAIQMASSAKGKDVEGYRADFIKMMRTAELLSATASK
ncbi:MAG: von Willebrand factor type A domain-containing protein [Bacteroidota bacterium]